MIPEWCLNSTLNVPYGLNKVGGHKIKTLCCWHALTNRAKSSKMKYLIVICMIAAVHAIPVKEDGPADKFLAALRDCVETDTMLCLKV